MIKPTLLVLESPDRVGKTTLKNSIVKDTRITTFHYGKPCPNRIIKDGYFYQYYHLIAHLHSAILDRSWISRLFYEQHRPSTSNKVNFKTYINWHKQLEICFDIKYLFLHREWSEDLEKSHLEEISLGLGYGTIEERKEEHLAFYDLYQRLKNTSLEMELLSLPKVNTLEYEKLVSLWRKKLT